VGCNVTHLQNEEPTLQSCLEACQVEASKISNLKDGPNYGERAASYPGKPCLIMKGTREWDDWHAYFQRNNNGVQLEFMEGNSTFTVPCRNVANFEAYERSLTKPSDHPRLSLASPKRAEAA
jgi:hypothetical protein